jgi:hypothetical protein
MKNARLNTIDCSRLSKKPLPQQLTSGFLASRNSQAAGEDILSILFLQKASKYSLMTR